jgi:hypothetical protein
VARQPDAGSVSALPTAFHSSPVFAAINVVVARRSGKTQLLCILPENITGTPAERGVRRQQPGGGGGLGGSRAADRADSAPVPRGAGVVLWWVVPLPPGVAGAWVERGSPPQSPQKSD